MFTGIITDIGEVTGIEDKGDLHLRIACTYPAAGIDLGASIACDGICLTVVDRGVDGNVNWFDVTASAETISITNLGSWTIGRRINLERALKLGDELGGHIVSGHVDGIAEVLSISEEGESTRFSFSAPEAMARFIAQKGSVALNGTSLTVNEVSDNEFGVNIIPHTITHTTWGDIRQGDKINLEIDTLARYVARLNEIQGNT